MFVTANDGVRLYYEEAGPTQQQSPTSSTTILLVHGGGCSLRWWDRSFTPLSHRARVIAVDVRGCGRSDKPRHGHRTARYAQDLRDLIEALELSGVVLVGWSIGARTVLSYLELFVGHQLRGAVFVDDCPHISEHAPPDPDAEDADDPEEGEDEMAAMRRTVLSMFSPASAEMLSAAELDLLAAENLMSRQNAETLSADYQAADWRPMLPTITVPMLLVAGSDSGARVGVEFMARHIPKAKLVVLEGGHACFMQDSEAFNAAVEEFASGLGGGRARL